MLVVAQCELQWRAPALLYYGFTRPG